MQFDENIPLALYYRLKMKILDEINSGEWKPGDKLPNEFDLCEKYKVSRITIRQALAGLEKEGFVVRKQGKGTFVTIPKIEQSLSSFYSFSEVFKAKGLTPHNKVMEFKKRNTDSSIAGKFGKEAGYETYYIKRLRYAGDLVYALEHTYIPAEYFDGLRLEQVEKQPLYDIMRNDFSIVPDSAKEYIGAASITEKDAALLDIKKGMAVLDIERITMSGKRYIEFTKSLTRSDVFKFEVNLK